jgi:antitoxin (DNA-binding transcriptional repressor) of toxin-antitoxin stability system
LIAAQGRVASRRRDARQMDNQTTYGHDMTMKAVKIADLKSHLSRHLREVRGGRTLTVLDRNTPVARLVPIDSGDDVLITLPGEGSPALAQVKLPSIAKLRVDVVKLLLDDRRSRG